MAAISGRNRVLLAISLVVAFGVGMAAQMLAFGNDAAGGPDLDLRLVPDLGPDWTLRGHDVVPWPDEVAGLFSTSYYGRGDADNPFADENLVIYIDRTPEGQRGYYTSSQTVLVRGVEGTIRQPEGTDAMTLSWNDTSGVGVVAASTSRSVDQLVAIAERLDLEAAAPLGSEFDGLTLLAEDLPLLSGLWTAGAESRAGQSVSLQVGAQSTWFETLFQLEHDPAPVEVRGGRGLSVVTDDHRHLIWREDGLAMNLSGPLNLDLVTIADGLREVDAETWAELSADR